MKILVTVTETYSHTYLVEAKSKEDAERYAEEKGLDCDPFNDYCEMEYEARLPEGENLNLYDFVKNWGEWDVEYQLWYYARWIESDYGVM